MFLTAAPAPPSPSEPHPSDGRRAGATWVAATGAFLLVAAAAVFIAVRWDSLPEPAKLALVGGLTGGFLAGGRALRRTLPATGDVLFHLGAFLLPVDVAGLCLRAGVGWRHLVLSEGVLGIVALGALGAATGSVVLGWAAAASMLVLALGVAAVSPVPAPLVLAIAAGAAHLLRRRRPAIVWAAAAGLAPVLATGTANVLATIAGRDLGAGTLSELGLTGTTAAMFAVVSGLISAVVLGREAHHRKDLALVVLAGASLLCGAGTAWAAADPADDVAFLTAPAVFLAIELAAMVAMRDAFWRRPARAVALGGEVLALLAAPVAALLVLVAPLVEEGLDLFGDSPGWTPEPAGAAGWALFATAWFVAGWRRQSPKTSIGGALVSAIADDCTVAFVSVSALAAVVVGTASTPVIAGVLLIAALGLAHTRGVVATLVAVAAAAWAPIVVAPSHEVFVLPVGLAAAGALVVAARRWEKEAITIVLTAAASGIVICASSFAIDRLGVTAALLVSAFGAWSIALAVEQRSEAAAHLARTPLLLTAFVAAVAGTPGEALAVALAATMLLVVDALRTDDPRIAFGASLTGPLAVLAAARLAELTPAESGVVLAGGAVVLGGMAALTPARWRQPVLTCAASSMTAGLVLSTGHPARFAEALILAGGLVIALGLSLRNAIVAHAGGALASIGIAVHLTVDGVTATEPFLLPVSLQLLVLGVQLRRRRVDAPSSWIAFGPPIALLGVAALAERIDGGPAWHSLVAGAVGMTAVVAGGWKRLAAPLFLGTALIGSVTVLETLHTLAGVPTWAWLAAGGSALLLTGVALERSATSPSEAGRRLVDVVSDRFE